jgi:hypothetical protein
VLLPLLVLLQPPQQQLLQLLVQPLGVQLLMPGVHCLLCLLLVPQAALLLPVLRPAAFHFPPLLQLTQQRQSVLLSVARAAVGMLALG